VGSDGQLSFGGGTAFVVVAGSVSGGGNGVSSFPASATNSGVYTVGGAATYTGANETLTFQSGQGTASVALTSGDTVDTAVAKINAKTAALGIYAVKNTSGNGISIQSTGNFSASTTAANGTFTATGGQTTTPPTTTGGATGNAVAALTAINSAITQLGQVQARIGAGENHLSYAITLANSQITNFSAAESGIRDADVATAAANLTKAQVLQQASVAALAQANSAPQALLKLLQQ
jgi:flagellin